jgi:DNA-binding transcriptional ArsR family regulator
MAMYDDPRILRAIAHPTRNRILSELYAAGSLRAADIARLIDVPANQASFHLRQLAKYGLVEEAPDDARDRRDRVWRLADADGVSFRTEDMVAQPGGEAAYEVFRRNAVAWGHHLVDRAYARDRGREGRNSIAEWALRLTPDEAQQLMGELGEVIDRWRGPERAEDEDRRTYSIFTVVQPYPETVEEQD